MTIKKSYHIFLLLICFSLFIKDTSAQIEIINSDSIPIENALAVCTGEDLLMTLTGIPEDQIDTVYWDFGDGNTISIEQSINYVYKDSGDFQIWTSILYIDGSFVDSIATRSLTISPSPEASFTMNNQNATLVNSTVKFFNQSTGAESYYWLFDTTNMIGESFEENPAYTFPDKQPNEFIVMLVATSVVGCESFDFQKVTVLEDHKLYIPNSFTPNGDGNNDFFYIQGKKIDTESYHLTIYDRWGQVVFDSTNLYERWNGSNNNGEFYVQSSIFNYSLVYRVIGSFDLKEITGSINLLK
jgi:gliding motility-associated-like protein